MTIYQISTTVKCPECDGPNIYSSIRLVQPLELELTYSDLYHNFYIEGLECDTATDYDDRMYHECRDCFTELTTEEILQANLPTP